MSVITQDTHSHLYKTWIGFATTHATYIHMYKTCSVLEITQTHALNMDTVTNNTLHKLTCIKYVLGQQLNKPRPRTYA